MRPLQRTRKTATGVSGLLKPSWAEHRAGCRTMLLVLAAACLVLAAHGDELKSGQTDVGIILAEAVDASRVTNVACRVAIAGEVKTPASDGTASWKLSSGATFDFMQQRFTSEATGPFAVRAIRRFTNAETVTTVAGDHRTSVALPSASRLIQVFGSESGLIQLSPEYRLTRPQLDVLQIPCDPLIASALLPSRRIGSITEKWNADVWVVPLLVGIDAAVSQSAECQLKSIDETTAVVVFACKAQGAVTGSSTDIEVTGELTFDRRTSLISRLMATLREKREPGPISPGLDATATMEWTQTLSEGQTSLAPSMPDKIPDEHRLLLTLVTPWRSLLLHTRDWHIFHETGEMVMLRMVHDGALVAQCNLSAAPQVAAGKSTEEEAYLAEVEQSLAGRGGRVVSSRVTSDSNGWRIHRVSASGTAATGTTNEQTLLWDYCLCSAPTGEQLSVVFSHAKADSNVFDGSIEQMLGSLTLRPSRQKVALPR